jgi:uncharacterized protein (DUF1330 family)
MKAKHAVAAMVGSFALGAVAVQSLHAQAKPFGYLLAEVAVKVDEETYNNSQFMKETVPTIQAAGGKYLARGFKNATALAGAPAANRLVLIQFENIDKAKAWYANGQQERQDKEGSKVASSFRILAFEGVEQK